MHRLSVVCFDIGTILIPNFHNIVNYKSPFHEAKAVARITNSCFSNCETI